MVPITFLYDWEFPSDKDRQTVMYEFAANGAKHLVLSDTMLQMIGRYPRLYREFRQEVANAGLDFVDAHAPFRHDCDPLVPDPAIRPYMLAHLKYILQIVSDFGVKTCCVHTINKAYPEYTLEQQRDAICASLDEILAEIRAEPEPELAARYEERYQAFRRIYPALKEVFPLLQTGGGA